MPPAARQQWIDVLKGAAIFLVVLFHADLVVTDVDGRTYAWAQLDKVIMTFVMPLFFLVAGYFVAPWLQRPWALFLRRRVAPQAYLYLLWVCLLSLAVVVVPTAAAPLGKVAGPGDLVDKLWQPGITLWFLYALALYLVAARATRVLPASLVLFGGVVVSAVAFDLGDTDTAAWTKTCGFLVFFLAGVRRPPLALRLARGLRIGHAVLLSPVYVLLAPPIGPRWGADHVPGWSFVVSALSLAIAIPVARLLAPTRIGGLVARLGRQTLGVYLLHVPLLLPATWLLERTTLPARTLLPVPLAVLLVAASLLVLRVTQGIPGLYAMPQRAGRPVQAPALPPLPTQPSSSEVPDAGAQRLRT